MLLFTMLLIKIFLPSLRAAKGGQVQRSVDQVGRYARDTAAIHALQASSFSGFFSEALLLTEKEHLGNQNIFHNKKQKRAKARQKSGQGVGLAGGSFFLA